MCGFAGFVHVSGPARSADNRQIILSRMGAQLAQRGPDDQQIYDDGVLSLVFRRLSIVDVDNGRQPFWNEAGTVLCVANGEIYNHQELRAGLRGAHTFTSRSDCEVLVHLFEEQGLDLLQSINGMFAILLWDREDRTLHLARDRMGIKPLYIARLANGLLFGSELKALLAHPDCPADFDWASLDLGYLDGQMYTALNFSQVPTFVKGIEQLPGGTAMTVSPDGGVQTHTYWSIDRAIDRSGDTAAQPPDAHANAYADLVEDAVQLRMMSDVPVGLFLSGGLDSSIIAALAARTNPGLECFTVISGPTIEAGDVARAKSLANDLQVPWHPVLYDHTAFAQQLAFGLAEFEYFIWMLDAPRFAPEQIFKHELHRYAKTVQPDLKVMLLGQGVDEFAGGYSRPLGGTPHDWNGFVSDSLRQAHRRHGQVAQRIHPEIAGFLSDQAIMAYQDAPYHREMRHRIWSLQSHNLWNEDRVSSAQGVEARVPFLDHRIVELMAAIPPAQHAELFLDKTIVRMAAKRWLPDQITQAPKVPFWEVGDTTAVHSFMRDCALRVYPDFRASYCENADAMFSGAALDRLHSDLTNGVMPLQNTKRLLCCMAVAVFDRLCRDIRNGGGVTRLSPPSPLQAAQDLVAR